jgi:hypothetical protein
MSSNSYPRGAATMPLALIPSVLVGSGHGELQCGAHFLTFGSVNAGTSPTPLLTYISFSTTFPFTSTFSYIPNTLKPSQNVSTSIFRRVSLGLAVPKPRSLQDRGNFKMNGSLASVKKIVEDLNSADLDGKTGKTTHLKA